MMPWISKNLVGNLLLSALFGALIWGGSTNHQNYLLVSFSACSGIIFIGFHQFFAFLSLREDLPSESRYFHYYAFMTLIVLGIAFALLSLARVLEEPSQQWRLFKEESIYLYQFFLVALLFAGWSLTGLLTAYLYPLKTKSQTSTSISLWTRLKQIGEEYQFPKILSAVLEVTLLMYLIFGVLFFLYAAFLAFENGGKPNWGLIYTSVTPAKRLLSLSALFFVALFNLFTLLLFLTIFRLQSIRQGIGKHWETFQFITFFWFSFLPFFYQATLLGDVGIYILIAPFFLTLLLSLFRTLTLLTLGAKQPSTRRQGMHEITLTDAFLAQILSIVLSLAPWGFYGLSILLSKNSSTPHFAPFGFFPLPITFLALAFVCSSITIRGHRVALREYQLLLKNVISDKTLSQLGHELVNQLYPVRTLLYSEALERLINLPVTEYPDAEKERLETVIPLVSISKTNIERSIAFVDEVKRRGSFGYEAAEIIALEKEVFSFLEQYRAAYRSKNAVFQFSSSSTSRVFINPNTLQQILRIYLDNAVEATQPGKQNLIEVIVEQIDTMAKVEVRDQGTGMSEPSKRSFGEKQISKKSGGTGIGTRIAKDYVEAFGGRTEVTFTAKGEGTWIAFYLPLK